MKVQLNDGGRKESGYKGNAGDCVVRAIAIASSKPYQQVYDDLNRLAKQERPRTRKQSNSREGVWRKTCHDYILAAGFRWVPCMKIGSGCTVHLRSDELPTGRLIVALSRHFAAVIDHVIHDTHDCSREGTRCVYGYYIRE